MGWDQILEAKQRIATFVHRTPVVTCSSLDRMYGASIFFKCENLQRSGSFKMRGASNAVFSLEDGEASRGVATHSSGNHASALAKAAAYRGIPCYVVMPRNAPEVKKKAVAGYGAQITYCEPTLKAREEVLEKLLEATKAAFIHPYNDPRVIAGQGTAALELLEEIQALDAVIVPVGGGGLLSGTALTVWAKSPGTKVLAGEPERADDAIRSLREGRIVAPENPDTVADGLRTSLGSLTFPVIKELVHAIFPVSEEAILQAMRDIWERMKLVVEASGAVPLAAIRAAQGLLEGKRVGVVLSGGNVDLDRLPFISGGPWTP